MAIIREAALAVQERIRNVHLERQVSSSSVEVLRWISIPEQALSESVTLAERLAKGERRVDNEGRKRLVSRVQFVLLLHKVRMARAEEDSW